MQSNVRILFIGDVVGKPGRKAVQLLVPRLVQNHQVDLVIANSENAAGGIGVTPTTADELFSYGASLLTSGNHIWAKKEIVDYLARQDKLLRPANYPPGLPGYGSAIIYTEEDVALGIINLQGRVYMSSLECPFRVAEREIDRLKGKVGAIIIDFHAEATSEKVALGWFLDGRVAAVIGTHTHIQTSDERILPRGTGYITDAGMTGSVDSVIGMKREIAIDRFLTQVPHKLEVAKSNIQLQGVILEIDTLKGKCASITRVRTSLESGE
ncbi:MAG: TIGR00282 family metallophosphoesterase [Pseudomonadota bacterium]